jgi:hypothetical protein
MQLDNSGFVFAFFYRQETGVNLIGFLELSSLKTVSVAHI